jgi:hypothetical protein
MGPKTDFRSLEDFASLWTMFGGNNERDNRSPPHEPADDAQGVGRRQMPECLDGWFLPLATLPLTGEESVG